MFDVDSLKWFATLGVGGALAWGMFLVYRKDAQSNLLRFEQIVKDWQAQSALFAAIVKENTTAITANTITAQNIHQELRDMREERGFHGLPALERRA